MADSQSGARTRARRLENDLDSKFALLGHQDNAGMSAKLLHEIEALLQDLGEANDAMSREAAGVSGSSVTAMHMLQRHREILHDFTQELTRSKNALKAATERSQLLSSVRDDIREYRCEASRATDALLRERNAINQTSRAADDIIGQAQATRDAIGGQRSGFSAMGNRLKQISTMAPQVNALIGMIGRRKQRDKLILATVIGGCMALLLISSIG